MVKRILIIILEALSELLKLLLYFIGFILLSTAISVSCAQAQERIYITEFRTQADVEVYWSCERHDARVYQLKDRTLSSVNPSWTFTDNIYTSTKTIWSSPFRINSDLVVCLVEDSYKARIIHGNKYKRIFGTN